MTAVSPDAAGLLREHGREIAAAWARRIRAAALMPGGPPDSHCRRGVTALIDYQSGGDPAVLDRYVAEVLDTRVGKNGELTPAIRELMLLEDAVRPFLPVGDAERVAESIVESIRRMVAGACGKCLRIRGDSLRELAVHDERHRLARELHDTVVQSLYGVGLLAEAAARLLQHDQRDEVADKLQQIQDSVLEALGEVRIRIFALHRPSLRQRGLAGVLRERLVEVERRAGLEVTLSVEGDSRPPLDVEEELLAIGLELLNNALKHARASQVWVTLRQSSGTVGLEVVDDGVGFDPVEAAEAGGLGLRGAHERGRKLRTDLVIEARRGSGTRATITVPLDPRGVKTETVGEGDSHGARPDPCRSC